MEEGILITVPNQKQNMQPCNQIYVDCQDGCPGDDEFYNQPVGVTGFLENGDKKCIIFSGFNSYYDDKCIGCGTCYTTNVRPYVPPCNKCRMHN
jgi:hypothetical protein